MQGVLTNRAFGFTEMSALSGNTKEARSADSDRESKPRYIRLKKLIWLLIKSHIYLSVRIPTPQPCLNG